MSWNDFNNAEDQNNFDIIPEGTIAKVRMTIKPGGFNDAGQGWTGGYATHKPESGAVYLACEFVILQGEYANRKVWSNIGLFSKKNDNKWGNMGRSFIRGILNSARNIQPKDESPNAQSARRINGFADLDGIEFVGKVTIGDDKHGNPKNEIQFAVTPDQEEYAFAMGNAAVMAPTQAASSPASANATGKPSWIK